MSETEEKFTCANELGVRPAPRCKERCPSCATIWAEEHGEPAPVVELREHRGRTSRPCVYVAGPMSGIPQFNFPLFDKACASLRDRGYSVVPPVDLEDPEARKIAFASKDGSERIPGKTWADFLAADIKLITDGGVEGIVVLPGWEGSRGARLETFVARLNELPVSHFAHTDPLPAVSPAELDVAHGLRLKPPPLIGLTGAAGHGKDTVCEFIKEWGEVQGFDVRREGFADRLKLSVARIFFPEIDAKDAIEWCNNMKADGEFSYEMGRERYILTGRQFFQRYGTEAHRDVFGKDFWIDAVFAGADDIDTLVITDVRFPNEVQAIRDRGGIVWHITRPRVAIAESAHTSEQSLDLKVEDHVFLNDGSLEELRLAVYNAMDSLLS